jgi:D-sedoheptulose 7-phosphate isomerase
MGSFFDRYFDELASLVAGVETIDLVAAADLIRATDREGRKVILVGNGGSAAIAGHLTVDLVKAAGIRAVNFNDPSLITCFGNDYGYDRWVAEALKAHGDPGDLVILISSSGESDNILNAAATAEELGLRQLVLSGFSPANRLRSHGEVSLWVDSSSYNHVENAHQIWLLAVVDYLIDGLADSGTSVAQ